MKTLEQLMRRNIRVLQLHKVSATFMISIATIVPYWNELGLDQTKISLLQSVFLLTVVVMEVPSGYIADQLGRRNSMIAGKILATIGWMYYPIAGDFSGLMFTEFMLGLGYSFISGTDVSIRYDSLAVIGDEKNNLREDSRSDAYGAFGEGFAGLIGGGLATISLWAPVLGQAIWMAFTLPIVFFLTEPPIKKTKSAQRNPFKDVIDITKYALHGNQSVAWLILYSAMLGTTTYTMVWLMQPYYLSVGIPLALFGVIWFSKHMFLGLFMLRAEAVRAWLGVGRGLLLLPIIGVVSYMTLGIGFALWAVPAMIGFELIRGIQGPLIRDEINQQIPSEIRATVNSVAGLVARLMFAVFGIGIGLSADTLGLRSTMFVSAALYGTLSCIIATAMVRKGLITYKRR